MESATSRLGFGERVAIAGVVAGLAGTVAAMALPLAYPDTAAWVWRAIFWPSLTIMVVACVFLLGDIIVRPRFPILRDFAKAKAPAATGILVILAALSVGYWYIETNTRHSPKPAVVTPAPQVVPENDLQSRAGKYIFACPRPTSDDKRSFAETLADARQRAIAVGDTFGVKITLSEIPSGIRMDIEPKTTESAIKMGGIGKVTYEIRRVGPELYVTASMELPAPLNLIEQFVPIDPKSELSKKLKKMVEQMVGVPEGACRFL
jgi:hypothetical protein